MAHTDSIERTVESLAPQLAAAARNLIRDLDGPGGSRQWEVCTPQLH
jgi:hypothetical protein